MASKGNKLWKKAIFVGVCVTLASRGAHSEDKDVPVRRDQSGEIQRLIEQLDAPSFQQREAASRRLMEIGEPAGDLLEEAALGTSAEARLRASTILRTLHIRPLRTAFTELAKLPDDRISIERGMWLISRILNHKVRREELSRQLDEIAQRVRARLGASVNPRNVESNKMVEVLQLVLFEEYKFAGNVADYRNPHNSSLEKVLSTRKGLPILLSHVMVSVGDRLGIPIVGISAPGRYIVKYDASQAPPGVATADIFIDPFAGGKILAKDDLAKLFPGLNPESMTTGTPRAILLRMMNNLETHLFESGQHEKGQQVVEYKQILSSNRTDDDG